MTLKHNKKRNSGMIVDFLSAYIADNVVNKNYKNIVEARKVWNAFVKPNTELYKEICIHEAIRSCKINNPTLISEFIRGLKKSASSIDHAKLHEEKTGFIRTINETIKDEAFFSRPIKNYTELATVQIWLNLCSSRKSLNESHFINPAFSELEDRIYSIVSEKRLHRGNESSENMSKQKLDEVMALEEGEVDRLVVNIMREKLNNKLQEQFTDYQKTILQNYVFEKATPEKLYETLGKLRDETLSLLQNELNENKRASKTEKDKYQEIFNVLKEDVKFDSLCLNDDKITFYMSVAKLNDELKD